MESAWSYWINEPIYYSENSTTFAKRKHVYAELCTAGILPFVTGAGYRLRLSEKDLLKQLLRILFFISRGKKVVPKLLDENIRYETEQYFHFQHRLDTISWLQFWEIWGGIQDFERGSFGHNFCFQLPEFLWSWVSLEHSPSAIEFEKQLEEDEYQDELARGKDDPYLQDTSRRDYQDRHWF
jgi:hypothetical protein